MRGPGRGEKWFAVIRGGECPQNAYARARDKGVIARREVEWQTLPFRPRANPPDFRFDRKG